MRKGNLSDFFKNGNDFHFGSVDYESKEVKNEIEKVRIQQEKTLESMQVNLNELRKITFDI